MAKIIMYLAGAVFIIIGALGFMNNLVLGVFEVNTMHNIVHIASGVLALIFASQGETQARRFAIILAVVYSLVTILGFIQGGNILGVIDNTIADNILHLILTVVFLYVGLTKPTVITPAPTGII